MEKSARRAQIISEWAATIAAREGSYMVFGAKGAAGWNVKGFRDLKFRHGARIAEVEGVCIALPGDLVGDTVMHLMGQVLERLVARDGGVFSLVVGSLGALRGALFR